MIVTLWLNLTPHPDTSENHFDVTGCGGGVFLQDLYRWAHTAKSLVGTLGISEGRKIASALETTFKAAKETNLKIPQETLSLCSEGAQPSWTGSRSLVSGLPSFETVFGQLQPQVVALLANGKK